MEFAYCGLGLVGLLLLWMAISPRSMWETLSAWQFKNPEANEPSSLAFEVQRVTAVIGLIVIVVVGFALANVSGQAERDRQEQEYAECLERNDDDEGLLTAEDWCENVSPSPEAP